MYSAHIPKTEQLPPKQTRWIKKKKMCICFKFWVDRKLFPPVRSGFIKGAKSCCHDKRRERIDHVGRRRRSQFHLTMLISAWEETPPTSFHLICCESRLFSDFHKEKKQQQQQLRNKRSLPTRRRKTKKFIATDQELDHMGQQKGFKKQNKIFKIWVQTVILNTHASPTATLRTVFKKLWHKWVKWRFARVALLPSTV